MKKYLVGGAVRDKLLNFPSEEHDWVVVGATPEEMIAKGFRPVGKDFPVFLHPETHDEYALARTEEKTGRGYTQFDFYASPEVTLEQDLQRRDLTINAMAEDENGNIIDPYHGQEDLKNRLLRHVSPAFIEDPVRILRVARFAARYDHLGFTIAPETLKLMQEMVHNGEVDALVSERVWQEFERALEEKSPHIFFKVLDNCGALKKLFPELAEYYPKLNFGNNPTPIIRFATLTLILNQHEIKQLCQRLRVPDYQALALLANNMAYYFNQKALSPTEIMDLLDSTDAWRRSERLKLLLAVFPDSPHIELINKAFSAAQRVSAQAFLDQGLTGKVLGEAICEERLKAIGRFL